jgi:hypothetical protein
MDGAQQSCAPSIIHWEWSKPKILLGLIFNPQKCDYSFVDSDYPDKPTFLGVLFT